MTKVGERLLSGASEALEIAKGRRPAARVHMHGHSYVAADLHLVPQRLHDSEINASITWFYDADWEVRLGDFMNGWKAETRATSYDDALVWLDAKARELYPDSEYAKEKRG